VHDLTLFSLSDMVACCSAIRAVPAATLTDVAIGAAQYLHEHLIDKESGHLACSAVRVYLVDADGDAELLAAMGTRVAGDGHLTLASSPAVRRVTDAVMRDGHAAVVHIPSALAAFAGARHALPPETIDVLGLGVRLPEGRCLTTILYSRVAVPSTTTAVLRPVALSVGLAALDHAGTDERTLQTVPGGPWIAARVHMLRELVAAHEVTVRDQSARLDQVAGESEVWANELAASRSALVEVEAWTAAMRAASSDALFTIDEYGSVHDLNSVAERLFGWRREEAIGQDLAQLIIPPPLRDLHRRGLERARTNGSAPLVGRRVEMPAQDRHGNEFPVEITIASVVRGGRLFFTGSVRDLTELKRAERVAAAEARAYETLHRIGIGLLAELDHDKLLHTITDEATDVTDAEVGAFLWPSPDAGVGYSVGASSRLDELPAENATVPELLAPAFAGEIVRAEDVSRDAATARDGLPWRSMVVRSFLAVPVVARGGEVLGVLAFGHSRSAVFDERDARLAAGIAAQAAVAIENARLYQATEQARRAAERAADHLARLQALSELLSGHLDTAQLATLAVTHIRDSVGATNVALLLCTDTGALEMVADLGRAHDANRGTLTAAETAIVEDALRDDQLVTKGGTIAAIPLVFEARRLGAIAVSWPTARTFTEDDQRLLAAFGDTVMQALERARLLEAEQLAAARQAFLARAGVVLASSLDYETTLARVARLVVPELADSCTIHLVEQGRLPVVGLAHCDPELEQLLRDLSAIDEDQVRHEALYEVARTGRPLLVPDVPPDVVAAGSIDAHEAATRARLGIRSGLAVPLVARGQSLGVLALTMGPSGRRFTTDDLRVVEDLARRAALAIDNAHTFAVRSEAARTLQTSLLPPMLPDVPGAELAARYRPAEDGSLVGGDFYDVFPVAGQGWGLVLGDVSGKGVAAASLTALVRYTIRAMALIEPSPAAVLRALNQAVLDYGASDRYCTVAYLVLAPAGAGVRVLAARGGHPAPLRIQPSGRVEPLGTPGTGIGLVSDPDVVDTTHDLEPGDLLVLYTDGFTDARAADGRFAAEILPAVFTELAGNSAESAASILERSVLDFTGGAHRDDMAMIVARILSP
jgi:PAS domain S-box-containing protein